MAIDYGQDSGLAYPKVRVRALDRADKAKAIEAQDRKENAKARKRAKGRCEVVEVVLNKATGKPVLGFCTRKDAHTHHLLSGIGRKNIGRSILASAKIRVCESCHTQIHSRILQPTTATTEAATIRFRRVR
jgi:hypothetical protein